MKSWLFVVLFVALNCIACKKETADCDETKQTVNLANAAPLKSGQLTSTKTDGGLVGIYKQQDGKLVLSLKEMSLSPGSSLVIYLSPTNRFTSNAIKITSVRNLEGDVVYFLPNNLNIDTFTTLLILSEPSEEVIASADLH